jgi:hypothetical protein
VLALVHPLRPLIAADQHEQPHECGDERNEVRCNGAQGRDSPGAAYEPAGQIPVGCGHRSRLTSPVVKREARNRHGSVRVEAAQRKGAFR